MTPALSTTLREATRRPLAVYTAECLASPSLVKTAVGLLRFAPERVRAVVDERHGGVTLDRVRGWAGFPAVPVVADLDDLPDDVTGLAVGLALAGSRPLLDRHRKLLQRAADRGLLVFNGLHDRVGHPDVVELRRPEPADLVLASGPPLRSRRVLTVGSAPNTGKMTTAVLLQRELVARGQAADLLATGQTGMLLRGHGRAVDAYPSDFAAGVVERLVLDLEVRAEVVVVEGQGSILTPTYSAVTVAVIHGCRPQHHVVCHRASADGDTAAEVVDTVRRHDRLFDGLGLRSQLLGVALDSRALDAGTHRRRCAEVQDRLGVACVDPVRDGIAAVADAFAAGATGARP